ncbi:MAG: hypothetical protein J1F12_02545 [Muribaculaceae bacterium]|nr:hypothetical protein [Muribaculaceae bacterium]
MSSIKKRQLIFLQVLALFIISAVSCNSKSSDEDNNIVVTPSTVAIKNFYLKENDKVLSDIDSVFFSIDLNTGVIFNADSLPKGTDVSRLIPVITFANSMTKAELTFVKDNEKDTVVNYLTNPEDSIDFSSPVALKVIAADGLNAFTYHIKVNVHKQNPDSLMWDKLATSPLPARYEKPVAQKTLYVKPLTYTFVEEYNGQYTFAVCDDLNEGEWDKQSLDFNFVPRMGSFAYSDNKFWVLDEAGYLYSSPDGIDWNNVGEIWTNILGNYNGYLLGIKEVDNTYYHSSYPNDGKIPESLLEDNFPLNQSSTLGIVDSSWTPQSYAIMVGGVTSSGEISSDVWAFDGRTWAVINQGYLPPLQYPMMARYIIFRETPYLFLQREMEIWLLFGGVLESEEMNREVYLSYDNGVHWSKANDSMQLPEIFPSLKDADVIVSEDYLSANLSDAWTIQPSSKTFPHTRVSYSVEGDEITWLCPYLYVFGGYLNDNNLSNDIWRGVLAKLMFTPNI